MFLIGDEIQEVVTNQTKIYLASQPSFLTLKSHILSKAPIPQIRDAIATALTESKNNEQLTIKKNLETQMINTQQAEDKKQERKDSSSATKDQRTKTRLQRELQQVSTELSDCRMECGMLERKLAQLTKPASHHKSGKKTTTPIDYPTLDIKQIQHAMESHKSKLRKLVADEKNIQMELTQIKEHAAERQERMTQHAKREHAQATYLKSGTMLEESLSVSNWESLNQSMQEQAQTLDNKYVNLSKNAEQINYPTFLDEIEKNQKNEALQIVLKLLRNHLNLEHELINTKNTLKIKRQTFETQTTKLNEFKTQLNALENNTPALEAENKKLQTQNAGLHTSFKHNKTLIQQLSLPALFLLSLAFLSVIPVILVANGVIPFFIAPVLLYLLVCAPPALLLLTSMGLGVATLVHVFKSNVEMHLIAANLRIIESNSSQIKHVDEHLTIPQGVVIPDLEAQIKADEVAIENLTALVKDLKTQAEQTFKQAKEIKPVSSAGSSLFSQPEQPPAQPTPSYKTANAAGLS